jgi:hypothetical protein
MKIPITRIILVSLLVPQLLSADPEATRAPASEPLQIGWAKCDTTPPKMPVIMAGQFHVRISEGVENPLTATALALSSGKEEVVFVSVDLVSIPTELRDAFRARLAKTLPELNPRKVILNATHSHTAPEARDPNTMAGGTNSNAKGEEVEGFPVPGMSVSEYREFLADTLARCVAEAWKARKPGSVAFGMDYAVVGRNRRWVDKDGQSHMYVKTPEAKEIFRSVEGCEDHSVNLLATYDAEARLTGVVVNIPCPSQESESSFLLSSDFWHETRQELARRLGDRVFLLPQCSAAGDMTSHLIHGNAANNRMLELRGQSKKEDIGRKIAEAVERILPAIAGTAERAPAFRHEVADIDLPATKVSAELAGEEEASAEKFRKLYAAEVQKLKDNPDLKKEPRWYIEPTKNYRRAAWHSQVKKRFDEQQRGAGLTLPSECHFVRLGDIAFATNPFEYFLDYGTQIKMRSPFIQTFLVQLAGSGTYVPSPRAASGGGYGAVPASNPVGPEGGQVLADETVARLKGLQPSPGQAGAVSGKTP